MSYNLLQHLTEERTTYAEMIDFCCDNHILNNDIFGTLADRYDYEPYAGSDYDEEAGGYLEIMQWYIIGEQDADRLRDYTNELVFCFPELNLYILGVTHWGTPWSGVDAN